MHLWNTVKPVFKHREFNYNLSSQNLCISICATLGLHLSTNINPLMAKIPYKKIIFPIFIIFGIYSLIHVDFWNHLTGRYGFSITTGNILINSIYYIGIVLMIIVLLNLDKLTQKN